MPGYWGLIDEAAGYWSLQETSGTTAIDSAEGRHGVLNGGQNFLSASVAGPRPWLSRALSFDGVNDYVTLPSQVTLGLSAEFSYSLWRRPNAAPPWSPMVLIETGGTTHGATLSLEGTSLYGVVTRSTAKSSVQATAPAAATWQHVALVIKAGLAELYLDGVLAGSASLTTAWTQAGADIGAIGAAFVANWHSGGVPLGLAAFFSGSMAGVAVIRRALLASEVGSLFQGPEPSLLIPPSIEGVRASEASAVYLGEWNPHANGTIEKLFDLQTSDDGLAGWTTVAAGLEGDSVLIPLSLQGRYVRLRVVASNGATHPAEVYSDAVQVVAPTAPARAEAGLCRSGGLEAGAVKPAGAAAAAMTLTN